MVRSMTGLVALALVGGCQAQFTQCFGTGDGERDAVVDVSGGEPVFDWDVGSAYSVWVSALDGDVETKTMWHAQCGGADPDDTRTLEGNQCIPTPLIYGEPGDAPELEPSLGHRPLPLTPGATYRVELFAMVGADGHPPPPEPGSLEAWLDGFSDAEDKDDPNCGSVRFATADFVAP